MTLAVGPLQPAPGPWNPGIHSEVPAAIRHLCTYLRPENVLTTCASAAELHDLTGLDMIDVVAFRPERLALHELLIRVTADLSVPDGSRIEDLGINFREITRTILQKHVEPRMASVSAVYHRVRRDLGALIDREAAALFGTPVAAPAVETTRWFASLGIRARRKAPTQADPAAGHHLAIVAAWDSKAHAGADALQASAYRALSRVVSALLVRHGQLWGSREMVTALACDIASNHWASNEIGRLIEPWVLEAASAEGYQILRRQDHPVVMNTKGASASGKSTLRPLQKRLASEIGVDWREFALISPDIWRKQLLDYASLGEHYRYAGSFTGEELKVIDQKLDRYMARKAGGGNMPHLLIDRFRFDSFAADSDEAGSNLLTRFGQILYLFFMITPPASLVERAWNRGVEVGRYKAVEDTLAHGVEAYEGMPDLFFTWAGRRDKRVHFEFLDNSVRLPERPRTVAFGWNETMNILDVGSLLDVERYRRVDIHATAPQQLYAAGESRDAARNAGFLCRCLQHFHEVNFADRASGRVYLRTIGGKAAWSDRAALARAIADPGTRAGIEAAVPGALEESLAASARPVFLGDIVGAEPIRTLGDWGAEAPEREGSAGVSAPLPARPGPAAHRA